MTTEGPKYLKIELEAATGKLVKLTDENGRESEEADRKKMQEIYDSPDGFKLVGMILHAHSSPGCFYYCLPNGYCIVLCFPQP